MKKDTLRGLVAGAILLVLYNLIAFVIPFEKTAVFWLSYAFTMVSIGVLALAVYMAFLKNTDAKSRFYGFPIARLGLIYAVVQTLVSLLAMALATILPWQLMTVVYALGLGAVLLGLIGAETVVENIQTQDATIKVKSSRMRALQAKVAQLNANCDCPELKKLAEELRYSDPVSGEDLAEIEADLSASVDQLQDAVVEGDYAVIGQLCKKTSNLLAERNRLCKLTK